MVSAHRVCEARGLPKMVSAHRALQKEAYPKWSVPTEQQSMRPTQNGQCPQSIAKRGLPKMVSAHRATEHEAYPKWSVPTEHCRQVATSPELSGSSLMAARMSWMAPSWTRASLARSERTGKCGGMKQTHKTVCVFL